MGLADRAGQRKMKFWGTEQVVFDACGLDTSAIVEVGLRATHYEVVVT